MRKAAEDSSVAEVDPSCLPIGEILQPMEQDSRRILPGWVTPLAPWGGFNLPSGFAIVEDDGKRVIEWTIENNERALVTGDPEWRNYSVAASIKPIDVKAMPNADRNDWREALVGVIFRMQTSRFYYHFGIEGRHRAVLYRRMDDEWFELAVKEVEVPDDYLNLEVGLDGDGIRCICKKLDVNFFVTDTMFPSGKAGIRAMARARCSGVRVNMTPSQRHDSMRISHIREMEEISRGREIPGAKVIRKFDLSQLGGAPQFLDFAHPGRYDMLIAGNVTRAITVEGKLLWEIPLRIDRIVASTESSNHGRMLYGYLGTRESKDMVNIVGSNGRYIIPERMCVIKGDTGEIVAERPIPEMDRAVRMATFSTHTGRLSSRLAYDIVFREWSGDYGNGGVNLWAYDGELEPLWEARVDPPYGHGHSIQFEDVDRDGRDEVLVGGTLLSPEGEVIWVHDLSREMARISGAHHYDAVSIGNFAGDEEVDPVAFILGGSAGVYVVDGLTGRTRMVHRIGHAQGRVAGKVRPGLPGTEVLVACRWGNMGILTLFSGQGDRLWSIQPDYLGQGSCPIKWGTRQEKLIWTNTTAEVQAFYDGYGRRVKDLPVVRELYGDRMRKDVATGVVRMGEDPRELLSLRTEDTLYILGPDMG